MLNNVTMPFLNMCELSNPSDLLVTDLAAGDHSTLKEYLVKYSFDVEEPQSPLAEYILKCFATRASIDLAR